MKQTRLALLIPDGFTRSGVEGLIKSNRHISCKVLAFFDFSVFLAQGAAETDILLMDVSGISMKTLEMHLGKLRAEWPEVSVVVISSQLKVQTIRRIMQLGAKGFIFRDDISDALLNTIDLAARGVIAMSPQALELLTNANQLYVADELKPLDRQILCLTAEGKTVKAIAAALNVSTRTVYRSRDKLRVVLGVQNNETLIDAAREQGLLDCD